MGRWVARPLPLPLGFGTWEDETRRDEEVFKRRCGRRGAGSSYNGRLGSPPLFELVLRQPSGLLFITWKIDKSSIFKVHLAQLFCVEFYNYVQHFDMINSIFS